MKHKNTTMRAAAWAAGILPAGLKRLFYRIPFLSRMIRRSLNAVVPAGYTDVKISAGPARGLHMKLDLRAEKDYWLGTYEPDLQAAARKLVQPGGTVYDVGANIGFISLACANLVGMSGRVFSFEALPANIERLTENVHINQLSAIIQTNHCAVIDRNSPVTFLTHTSGAMGKALGSAGRDEKYQDSITVPGISLDDFAYTNGNLLPDLIKLDIEGGEGNALKGAQRILAEQKPILLIELHGEVAARQVWEILSDQRFSIHELKRGFPRVSHIDALDWKAYIAALPESINAQLT